MTSHPATRSRELAGELTVTGRLLTASNASFVASVATPDGAIRVVYKPIRGEQELWDFPSGTLAGREVAAHRISAAGGFDVVPYTTMIDGPFGPGSVQIWVDEGSASGKGSGPDCEPGPDGESAPDDDPESDDDLEPARDSQPGTADDLVDVVAPDQIPDGWHPVLYGEDERAELVAVVHADDDRLRRLAVFDALINNADRKAGHLLVDDGHVLGCDHGLSFHVDDKLRTLLWGWAGQPLTDPEQAMVRAAIDGVDEITDLVADEELEALRARAEQLLRHGLPTPRPGGPAVPWPLW